MSDDVEALAQVMHDTFITERTLGGWLGIARAVLASDWYAERLAEARREGIETMADVEAAHGQALVDLADARDALADARREVVEEP